MPKAPTLDSQRAVLAEKEARFRLEAWERALNADLLSEDAPEDATVKAECEKTRAESDRLYRLADACAARLAKLPRPKPPKPAPLPPRGTVVK